MAGEPAGRPTGFHRASTGKPGKTMKRKIMVIATAAGAAVLIALSSHQVQQAQGTTQATLARSEPDMLMPGHVISSEAIDFIEYPGRYGLGSELPGSRYAIVDGHLVRIDSDTMELQSILRKDSVALNSP